MSLQRLLIYSPLAALVAVCLAVRVASEETARTEMAREAAPRAPGTSAPKLQSPRSLDAPVRGSATPAPMPASTLRLPAAETSLAVAKRTSAAPAINAAIGATAATVAPGELDAFSASVEGNAPLSSAVAPQKHWAQKEMQTPLGAQTPLRKSESWTPSQVYGPPLPPDRVYVQKQAHQLRTDLKAGRITLVMDTRDGEQLERLERSGLYAWPAPPAGINVRSERQRTVLAGTTDNNNTLNNTPMPISPARPELASRSGEWERTAPNPADDPDFDPCALPPSPLLLRLLTTLAGHSTPTHPLEILSLLRPPYRYGGYIHVGPANPHSMGLAVDIGAYGGHTIRQSSPEDCVAGTLALLRDLPPGRYRLGMPKAPEGGWELPPALITLLNRQTGTAARAMPTANIANSSDATPARNAKITVPKTSLRTHLASAADAPQAVETESEPNTTACAISALYGVYASSAKPTWPFFPPPFTQVVADEVSNDGGEETNSTIPTAPRTDSRRNGNGTHTVLRFQNEAYAPETDLTDARLRKALEQARRRGVDVVAMFPDGADHIHIDVRQNP